MTASSNILRAVAVHAILCGALLVGSGARAAEPTKRECIDAHAQAQTQRMDGKLRASQASLRFCSEASCPGVIRDECTKGLAVLEPLVPSVVFEVEDGSGNALREVRVTMDGRPFAEVLDGAALPVDPGEHSFTLEIAGRSPVLRKLVFREGERRREEVTIGVPFALPAHPQPPPPSEPSPAGGSGQRIAGASAAGLGLVGVVVGGLFGLGAFSKYDDSKAYCGKLGDPNLCSAEGVALREDSRTAGTISTVAFVVGGVGLAAGAALWFTAPRGQKTHSVGIGLTGIRIGGVW